MKYIFGQVSILKQLLIKKSMKTKLFFMYAFASVLFAACNNDDAITNESGIVTDPNGEAYVALSIKTPATTRALHDPNQEIGTADESKVTDLKLVFFSDANPRVVTDVKDFTVGTDAEAGNPNQPTGTAGKAFKVAAGSKHVLVVANPVAAFAPAVGQSYDAVNAVLTGTVSDVIGANYNDFMMSNAKGGLEPSDAAGADVTLTLYTTQALAEANPCSINIDRVAAKVRVYADKIKGMGTPSATGAYPATISDAGWVLNVTNKKYYPCSERLATYFEGTAAGFRSPFDIYRIGSYRKDPNYDTQHDPLTDGTNYASDYNYYATAPAVWNNPTDAQTNPEVEYCLENTQTAAYNMVAYTTQVLFKAVITPNGLKNYDGSPATISTGDDWITIGSSQFTYASLLTYIKQELTNKYTSANPSLYSTPLTDALIAYLNGRSITGAPTLDQPTTPDAAPATKADSYVTILDGLSTAIKTAGAGSVGSFNYYEGGVSYYRIMIKHDDTPTALNELGEFGVVRNSVYDINITAINNPGYPTIPAPDPTIPDEDEEAWLSVQINVNPWTWYTQSEEL